MESGLLVALETALDDELIQEGLVREVLRQLQDARKKARFAVSDRIALGLTGADATAFVERYGEMLGRELLATSVTAGAIETPDHTEVLDVDRIELTAALRRA